MRIKLFEPRITRISRIGFKTSEASAVFAVCFLFGLTSCGTIQPGHDAVVVNAEKTIDLAKDTIDTLEQIEFASYATLKAIAPETAKQIRLGVNTLRRESPDWLQTAFNAKQAYKLNRTAENKAGLNTAIAVVKQAIADAEKYISQIKSKTSAMKSEVRSQMSEVSAAHLFAQQPEIFPQPAYAN